MVVKIGQPGRACSFTSGSARVLGHARTCPDPCITELLDQNSDEFLALGSKIASGLREIVMERPRDMAGGEGWSYRFTEVTPRILT